MSVTRLLSNAVVNILEVLPLAQEQREWGIIADQLIRLGTGDNTVELRLVTWQDIRQPKPKTKDQEPRQWHYISSRLDLTPRQIVELYH